MPNTFSYAGPIDCRFITYSYYRRISLREKLRDFIPEDIPCTNVIDVGCGTGVNLDAFDGGVGVDLVLSELQKKKDRFQICDITKKLPFQDNQFDFALMVDVLEHLEKPNDLLKEIHRITKFGFLAEIPTCDVIPWYYDPINCYRKKKNRSLVQNFGITQFGHVCIFEREKWEEMFSSLGFDIEKHEDARDLTFFECIQFFFCCVILRPFVAEKYQEIDFIGRLLPGVVIRCIHYFYSLVERVDPKMSQTVYSTWFCRKVDSLSGSNEKNI